MGEHYRFSGHETFQCKHFWLKKAYDYLKTGKSFKDPLAVVDLGVGKNMVNSMNHWLKVFGLVEVNYKSGEVKLNKIATKFFDDNGYDPYLEDKGTLYLLHYHLLASKHHQASLYRIAFQEFRKTRVSLEFTAVQMLDFLERKLKKEGVNYSLNSLRNDIKVFIRMYLSSFKKGNKNLEDDYSSLLIGLDLVSEVPDTIVDGSKLYKLEYNSKTDIDKLILLYAIMDHFEGEESIAVGDIQYNVADLLLCNRDGLESKLIELSESGWIVYKQDAGRKEIQLKKETDKWAVLNKYYGTV